MMYGDNLLLSTDYSYELYSIPEPSISITNIDGTAAPPVTTINGGAGQATGPTITFTGGTTGLTFNASGNSITLAGTLVIANGGTGATTAAGARTNLGLGTIATQDANNVTITGGSITGITDLAVADGGTGAGTAAGARTNLGAAASGDNTDITKLLGLSGGLRLIGYTSSAADPSTTELPADKDLAIHKNTTSGIVYLAFNDGGATIVKVPLV